MFAELPSICRGSFHEQSSEVLVHYVRLSRGISLIGKAAGRVFRGAPKEQHPSRELFEPVRNFHPRVDIETHRVMRRSLNYEGSHA